MRTLRPLFWAISVPVLLVLLCFVTAGETTPPQAPLGPKPETYWQVADVRPGMKGQGKTVMRGTKVEPFDAEVLGVLRNTSPGRDMIVCRLSGLDLERTGVISGMSGSPIYIEGKLLGAVAYAWPYGKDPIAGVTPFSQMHAFVEEFERRDLAEQGQPKKLGLGTPWKVGDRSFDSVTVATGADAPADGGDSLWLTPLRTPLAASGFSAHSLGVLRERLKGTGLVPVQGGAATGKVAEEAKNVPLEPGGPLAVSMIQGDFDLSGVGTVTHIEGDRVYGWGHPFMTLGGCDLPLQTAYIHTVYPRLTVSFKMGSPLQTVGVINADVSTGIAGWLGRKPDLLPIRMTVVHGEAGTPQVFNVETVRQRQLLPSLVLTAFVNSVDMEGDLPEEMTALMEARVELKGHEPLVIRDTFSGSSYSGSRAPQALYGLLSNVVRELVFNPFEPVRIERIECKTQVLPGRRSADIDSVELSGDVFAPGETVKGTVFLRPYKGGLERLPVSIKLPADLPEGQHSLTISDDLTSARQDVRDNPTLSTPKSAEQVVESVRAQISGRRTNLTVRLPIPGSGVAIDGKALPNLPPSMVAVLGGGHRGGAQTMSKAVVSRHPTDYVVSGSETVKIIVSKTKTTRPD